jgi:hypothetical protein
MAEIFQNFAGMIGAAHDYRGGGESQMQWAAEHLHLTGALAAAGAWADSAFDELFTSATIECNSTTALGEDLVKRGGVIDQCQMDGASTLANATQIAANCRVV